MAFTSSIAGGRRVLVPPSPTPPATARPAASRSARPAATAGGTPYVVPPSERAIPYWYYKT